MKTGSKSIGILDKDYVIWVKELVKRYRSSQIKAAIKVNKELLRYYWYLGKDNYVECSAGSATTGTAASDANHYELTLSDTSAELPYEVDATVIPSILDEVA